MLNNMHFLPELEGNERSYIRDLIEGLSPEQAQQFASAYREKRKDPQTVLLATVVGLFAIPGFQRFWLGQSGMGFLYLFTGGLVFIGTIWDLVTHKKLAFACNQGVARRIARNVESIGGISKTGNSSREFSGTHSPLNPGVLI